MSRLFDAPPKSVRPSAATDPAVTRAALASAQVDEDARALADRLGRLRAVTPVRYERERRGRWLVEHGRNGDDYLFQLHPVSSPRRPWQDVITGFIAAMDSIYPRSVQIHYKRPDESWEIRFFTIRVENVCARPGWEAASARAIDVLSAVDAWTVGGVPAQRSHSLPPGKRGSDEEPG